MFVRRLTKVEEQKEQRMKPAQYQDFAFFLVLPVVNVSVAAIVDTLTAQSSKSKTS